jgi:two-component system KDP operon response regulator KdpE
VEDGEKKITLTPTEGKLLKVLLENRKRVFTHRELVALVQGYETSDWEAPEVLRPLISRLRRKLAVFPEGNKWITNVRGTGYVFE